ncbi:MAG: hypothetical protein MHMPM18_001359 [Marteilia pararefringens]
MSEDEKAKSRNIGLSKRPANRLTDIKISSVKNQNRFSSIYTDETLTLSEKISEINTFIDYHRFIYSVSESNHEKLFAKNPETSNLQNEALSINRQILAKKFELINDLMNKIKCKR